MYTRVVQHNIPYILETFLKKLYTLYLKTEGVYVRLVEYFWTERGFDLIRFIFTSKSLNYYQSLQYNIYKSSRIIRFYTIPLRNYPTYFFCLFESSLSGVPRDIILRTH
jgi:hypothetical protein